MGQTAMNFLKPVLATPLIVALASSTPLTRELTPSWVEACNGTYLFSEDKKTWNDAYGECELYGSHLVQIDNLAENFCLLEYAHSMGYSFGYWNSANDITSEGVWKQYDEKLMSWTPWWQSATDEPNGVREENCGAVNMTGGPYAGQWYSYFCSVAQHYICERGF